MGKYILNEVELEVLRGFMDDLSIMTTSVPEALRALGRVMAVLKWARMDLKPKKSRSLVLFRGYVQKVKPFIAGDQGIPGLHNEPRPCI